MKEDKLKKVLIILLFIIIDIAIYIFLGLLMLKYEDFYNEDKGEYFSLQLMSLKHKVAYILLNIWMFINWLLVIFVSIKIIKIFLKKLGEYNK